MQDSITPPVGNHKSELSKARWLAYRHKAFWGRVDKGDEESCWLWTGLQKQSPKNPQPYGALGWEGKAQTAHRVAWQIANGPIPEGMMVLHSCDVSLCCNPKHLYLGDHARNMADMAERNRRLGKGTGADNGRAKLTQPQVDDIRMKYASGVLTQQQLAESYGVSQFAISQIVRFKRYV